MGRSARAEAAGTESPPVDRSQLQRIVEGLTDGVILIEPDQSISWANAAALRLHGVRLRDELGRNVDDYRRRFELRARETETLPDGEDPLALLMAGKTFSEVVVDVGRPGEAERSVHQIRSLVLRGADGLVDCLVLMINDVTEQFEAEARFDAMFNANPAPAIICRLADERFCKVNQGFCDLTGFVEADLLDRSVREIGLLDRAERRDLAMERLHAGRTIPQMEAWLPCPDGARLVVLAGQPIEIADQRCMLFTFADLQPRHEAHQALHHSERRFSAAFRLAPAPMLMLAADDHRIVDANDSFTRMSGHAHDEVVGRTESELNLLGGEARKALRAAKQQSPIRSLDVPLRCKDGTNRAHLLSAEHVTMDGQDSLLVTMQDISERKRTEGQLRQAIEQVLSDTTWFGQKVVEKLAELPGAGEGDDAGPRAVALSAREQQMLGLLAQGLSDRQMSDEAKVALNTVRNHIAAIYRKIGVHRRVEAVIWARERGFSADKKSGARATKH